MRVVQITVTKTELYWCHGYLFVQNADCRLQTADCRLQSGYKIQTENSEKVFLQLTTYQLDLDEVIKTRNLSIIRFNISRNLIIHLKNAVSNQVYRKMCLKDGFLDVVLT